MKQWENETMNFYVLSAKKIRFALPFTKKDVTLQANCAGQTHK